MAFEGDESSILLDVELDTLHILSARSLSIREVDLEHVGSEVLVEFDISSAMWWLWLWRSLDLS